MVVTASFGRLLRIFRQARSVAQVDLARRAGFSQGYISELERERRRPPTRLHVALLADALGLDENSRANLFLSAGFVPTDQTGVAVTKEIKNKVDEDIMQIIDRLLAYPREQEEITKDIIDRLDGWDLYQQALTATVSDKNLAKYLCRLIMSNERKSALIVNISSLYSKLK